MVSKTFFSIGFLSLVFILQAYGQDKKIDSLLLQLEVIKSPAEKVNTLNEIAFFYLRRFDSTGIYYANESLKLAEDHHLVLSMADAHLYLARLYHSVAMDSSLAERHFHQARQLYEQKKAPDYLCKYFRKYAQFKMEINDYEQALINYALALDFSRESGDSIQIANIYFNTGLVYHEMNNYGRALEHYFMALAIDEKLGHKEEISHVYNSIAISYSVEGNTEKAIEYYQKAILLEEEKGDKVSKAIALMNLGILYKEQNQLTKAFEAYQESLLIFKEANMGRGLLFIYFNMGKAHFDAKNYKEAIKNLSLSLELADKQNERKIKANTLTTLAEIYLEQAFLAKSLKAGKEALELAESLHLPEGIYKAHLVLYKIHQQLKDPARALSHHEKYTTYKDSVFNLEKSQQINELHTRFETEKKEQEIMILNKDKILQASELKSKTIIQNSLIGVFISTLLLIGFVYRSFKIRQENKRKLMAEQLKLEKMEAERLLELDRMKSRFFANIAHEFRTPLTLILGPAEQLEENPQPATIKKNIPVIKRSAFKLLNLINQLLDLSKMEEGKLALNRKNMDFVSFLKGISMSFESLAMEKDIDLVFDLPGHPILMGIDPDRTDKIFFNLLSNAFKFTPIGGSIEVKLQQHQDLHSNSSFVEVSIKDSGQGISQEHIPLLFNRFFQVEGKHQPLGGTGIGLALTKELVNIHAGSIAVESEEGKGTTFKVSLPLIPAAEAQEQPFLRDAGWTESADSHEAELVPADQGPEQDPQKPIVLIVEDNHDVRTYIKDCIEADYVLLEARNGKEGMEIARQKIPDLIITDVMMPEINGYQLCGLLKEDVLTNHIPVIILTAKAGMDSKLEGLQLGADDYLSKPFHRKELLIRIKNLLENRRLLQQKYQASAETEGLLPTSNEEEDPFIQQVKMVLEQYLDQENFGIESLCRELGSSRTQLHRKLKTLTGLSTSRFIRLYKIQKAMDLLKMPQYNISDVSYMTGFSSPSYFTQSFQEELGYSPSDFLKKKLVSSK